MAESIAEFPHISRTIYRIVVALLIVAGFLVAVFASFGTEGMVQGASDEKQVLASEIAKTLEVIENRPDYAGAWVRLSILYELLGEEELAKEALGTAKKLHPDF
ncbi:hypothetical protein HYZ70_03345 [Candidatus Curtissbacteria bacterium]|nr:hypothetical protein [Candidatus Curtissbacteria bacterium]